MSKKCCNEKENCRLGRVGGQAVIEGVMMKAGNRTVTSCRKDDGSITVNDSKFVSVRKKHKFLNIPILRGVVNFIEMMALSVKTLNVSAEALGLEEEVSDGKESWLKKHFGIGITDLVMFFSVILGLLLSVVLFIFLPSLVAEGLNRLWTRFISSTPFGPNAMAVIEGLMKVFIFIAYLALVSLMPDIKRTFMYHGAEHKSIACFESGEELTPANAMKHRRFHPRCGTSYMFLMILLGVFAGMFVRNVFPEIAQMESVILGRLAYTGIRLLILPLIMGIGYEILMLAGKHDNVITRIISAPGMWVQRITTKEPTEDMLEIAITSIKCALRDDYPEYMEFWTNKGWLPKQESCEAPAEEAIIEDSCAEEAPAYEESAPEIKNDASLTDESPANDAEESK